MAQTKVSAKDRLLKFFKRGGNITVNQARAQFGIQNVSARVSEIRQETGLNITVKTRTTDNGYTIRTYQKSRKPRVSADYGF